jgi:hypothetical protein
MEISFKDWDELLQLAGISEGTVDTFGPKIKIMFTSVLDVIQFFVHAGQVLGRESAIELAGLAELDHGFALGGQFTRVSFPGLEVAEPAN